MYAISVTKFFKSVYPFRGVVPLGGDSLFGHSRVGVALSSKATITIALVVVVLRIGNFFLFEPLPLCMILSIRPSGFAFRRTRHCIFEKIKLGGQLAILGCLFFPTPGIIIRSSLLNFEGKKSTRVNRARRTLNNLTSPLNLCLSKFTPPRDSRWKASIVA